MRVMAQMAMVMNLDKCIGCHTCSVTCKQAWTNRSGTEYVWFNNVETRPGPRLPADLRGPGEVEGRLGAQQARPARSSRRGGRFKKLLTIFSNPKLPSIGEYYEPWTYDYATLTDAPAQEHTPVARPKSLISGKNMKIEWSANWDDDLGGSTANAHRDPMLKKIADKVKFEFEQTFMFYLPRICEHCLNPSCAASCPSGAIYKREEDGIVLVDQDRCRGWRMCVSGCPYKKVYFNHRTGKAEKCTFCFPRIEVGPADGLLRDLRRPAALHRPDAVRRRQGARGRVDHGRARPLRGAARRCSSTRTTPRSIREAEKAGIPRDWVDAAQRSPIYALINTYKVALPLHPEYRTMPMVWYIPPLSPVVDVVKDTGEDAEDKGNLFAAIDALRIPVEYLAELFTAGDVAPVDGVLKKLAAMRSYMRDINMGREPDASIPAAVGMSEEEMYDMYRLLAIAKYDERYVIPPAHAEQAHSLEELATECSLDYEGGRAWAAPDRSARAPGAPTPIAVENFQMLQDRQTADTLAAPAGKASRVNLLNWDGKGTPGGLFPPGRTRSRRRVSRRHDRRPPLPAGAADGRLAVGLAAAGLPRRGAARPRLDLIRAASQPAAAERSGDRSGRSSHTSETTPLTELQADYVETFDTRRRCNLFLTYFAHGDTRKRGMALLRFKQTYLASGFELDDAELPDHLCVVLEYAATVDQRARPRS